MTVKLNEVYSKSIKTKIAFIKIQMNNERNVNFVQK